jgi:hypothetical protein
MKPAAIKDCRMMPMTDTAVPLVELDLSPILFKIQCEGETVLGEPIDPAVAELAYRRFLTMRLRYPDRTFVPSGLIDLVWHFHILDTRKYMADCERIFGYYLHHDPYFGINGDEDWQENQAAWTDTCALWEVEFSSPMIGTMHRCSSKDCR